MKYILFFLISVLSLIACNNELSSNDEKDQVNSITNEPISSLDKTINGLLQSMKNDLVLIDSAMCETSPPIHISKGINGSMSLIGIHNSYDFSEEDIFFLYDDTTLQYIKIEDLEIDRFNAYRRSVQYIDFISEDEPKGVLTKVATGNQFSIDSNFQQKPLISSRSNQLVILKDIASELQLGNWNKLQNFYCY